MMEIIKRIAIHQTHSQGQSLPSIVDCAPEHLVPDQFHIGWILTLDKAAQVMLDDITCWITTDRYTCKIQSVFRGCCINYHGCKIIILPRIIYYSIKITTK